MTISGTTRLYVLLADPVHHVRTPTLLNAYLAERGIDVAVVPAHVPPADLHAAVDGLRRWRNVAGIGVTVPHKESMIAEVDELTTMARLCGATNVVRRDPDGRLVGAQLDGGGFVRGLRGQGHDPAGRSVLLSGAGGTGRALAFALADAGASRLEIANRTVSRAEEVAAAVQDAFPACRTSVHDGSRSGFDLVVNASTLGMRSDDPLPVDDRHLVSGVVVAEVVMSPPITPLLALAQERGCIPHGGEHMLVAQFDETIQHLGLAGDAS